MAESSIDFSDVHFRSIILFNFKLGNSRADCHQNLLKAFQSNAVSYATVKNWYKRFERGQWSLKNDPRPGRPIEVVTDKNVSAVARLIKEDRKKTYEEIEYDLEFSTGRSAQFCITA